MRARLLCSLNRQKISLEEMLQRYVSHIPSRHFKMVRYYGFLANSKRDQLQVRRPQGAQQATLLQAATAGAEC
ncbi:hypothetical protein GCM10011328_08910 [Hafnia psychrotolerans]|uniref:Transposase IS801/IS1294 domain-containing protein n=1 Tax=Hafnia psychrotolerans TaxID=1477018 RepID=A0ABQ1G449_9GAMM|nr:hypothetical protein GCM10011328_08910 [Hafnia psychrotolerans]